jgi:hypothetical protein
MGSTPLNDGVIAPKGGILRESQKVDVSQKDDVSQSCGFR